jgi:hypothetical protein
MAAEATRGPAAPSSSLSGVTALRAGQRLGRRFLLPDGAVLPRQSHKPAR